MKLTNWLVLASMAYGGTVGLLYTLDVSWASVFTMVGALVLGLLWVANTMFAKKTR